MFFSVISIISSLLASGTPVASGLQARAGDSLPAPAAAFTQAQAAAFTQTPADAPDTLKAVTVVADRGVVVSRTDTVRLRNSISISDAFSNVPGLYVSDCGGSAGLKTVSIRGMGSPQAAIYVDGVRVINVQSGQTDLGMLDPANCSSAVIDYAQNSISYSTAKPVFGASPVAGRVRMRGGSFGTYEPSARMDFRLSDKVSLSAMASGLVSKGDFPLADGTSRTNNDIRQLRAGLDSWGRMRGGDWHAKTYYSGAERGTPGTMDWPSSDRQKDRNAFIQGLVRKQFSPLYMLSLSAKASYDDMMYMSEWGDNRYKQSGAQLNSSHKFSVSEWFDASFAADFQWDGLDSDLYTAGRTSVFSTLSAAFHTDRFHADFALEYAFTSDNGGADDSGSGDGGVAGDSGPGVKTRNVLSPSADIRWSLCDGLDISAFARRAYRTPTFNELYYPGFGNPALKAEDAWLTDLGVEYSRGGDEGWRFHAKADAFYNYLKNKIISSPSVDDPNIWLPFNIGIVEMTGTDIQTGLGYGEGLLKAGFTARYSLQNAFDRTPGSYSFGQQIPFVSRHTVCLGADASYGKWSLAASWCLHCGRYGSAGELPDYNTLDLTLSRDFSLKGSSVIGLRLMARNLADCRYELSSGYPMPGRSFYGEVDFRF